MTSGSFATRPREPCQGGNTAALSGLIVCREGAWAELTAGVTSVGEDSTGGARFLFFFCRFLCAYDYLRSCLNINNEISKDVTAPVSIISQGTIFVVSPVCTRETPLEDSSLSGDSSLDEESDEVDESGTLSAVESLSFPGVLLESTGSEDSLSGSSV